MNVAQREEPPPTLILARNRRQAMDWSLVLASQDIAATITQTEDQRWALLVEGSDAPRAFQSLRQYRQENRHWQWRQPLPWSKVTYHWGAVPACVLLALVYAWSVERPGLGAAWVFNSTKILTGEWWRLFTAVLLHGDLAHLLANVTTGVLLLGLAMARFGAGTGLLAAYLAGAAGNLAGLLLSNRPYTGLGASGMVMGALGLLAFHSVALWRTHPVNARDLTRGVLAGMALFLLFGVDPQSDVLAHLGGFAAGSLFGAALSFIPQRQLDRPAVDTISWLTLLGTLASAGAYGLARSPL